MSEDIDYINLIIKFLAREISDDEIYTLNEWLNEKSDNRRIFDRENELWQNAGLRNKLEYFDTQNAWDAVSKQIFQRERKSGQIIVLKKKILAGLIAAATVALLFALATLLIWVSGSRAERHFAEANWLVQTYEGEKARVLLPDSTQVILNSGSSLGYRSDYNFEDREVKLVGEAFFDVFTNPLEPFVVELDKMTLSASGTRFNVFSYKNENRIETTLEEGKLKVSLPNQEVVELQPGQQIVYFKNQNNIIVREVNVETYTSWKENKLRFYDTPFEEVLTGLARRYNVTFEVRSHDLLELNYTATFIDESIEDVMQMLKSISPIKYTIYNRTRITDQTYLKPKIVIEKR